VLSADCQVIRWHSIGDLSTREEDCLAELSLKGYTWGWPVAGTTVHQREDTKHPALPAPTRCALRNREREKGRIGVTARRGVQLNEKEAKKKGSWLSKCRQSEKAAFVKGGDLPLPSEDLRPLPCRQVVMRVLPKRYLRAWGVELWPCVHN